MIKNCAEKDRELGEAHAEIKALKFSERLKEKAVEEVLTHNMLNFYMLCTHAVKLVSNLLHVSERLL